MEKEIVTKCGTIRIGSLIHIDKVDGINEYQVRELQGRNGTVTVITEARTIYGTWGRLPVLVDKDEFSIIQY